VREEVGVWENNERGGIRKRGGGQGSKHEKQQQSSPAA